MWNQKRLCATSLFVRFVFIGKLKECTQLSADSSLEKYQGTYKKASCLLPFFNFLLGNCVYYNNKEGITCSVCLVFFCEICS